MKSTKKIWFFALFLVLVLPITACGGQTVAEAEATANASEIDPVAIFTSAAGTVSAQLTETAISFSPTPEPATATSTAIPATATLVDLNSTIPTAALSVEITATFLPGVPTFTPGAPGLFPTATQQILASPGGPICDAMIYGSPLDITIPDGTSIEAGTNFEKIWRIYNDGVCTWDDGYVLVPVGSSSTRPGDNNPLDATNPAWELKTLVLPGGVVDVGAKLTAPATKGEYQTHFMMQNDRGVLFGGVLTVIIIVEEDMK